MIQKNKFFLLIFLFIILTTYSFNEQKQNFNLIFPIKKIIIKNAQVVNLVNLKTDLEFLRDTSLFFLRKKKLSKF